MWKCSNCSTEVEGDLDSCWKCGTGKDGSPPEDPEAFANNRQDALKLEVDPGDGAQLLVRPRHPYDIIADVLFIAAVIVAVATVIVTCTAMVYSGERPGGQWAGVTMLASGALSALLIAAAAAVVRLLVEIVWNTRQKD